MARKQRGLSVLKTHAHHGVSAKTRHGLGGMKSKGMKTPKSPVHKNGVGVAHAHGVVKVPHTMHAARPGKGIKNHLARIAVTSRLQHFNYVGMPKRPKKVK